MPECIIISIGQAGNQIAHQVWSLLALERLSNSADSTFFTQQQHQKPRARGILIDMEQGVIGSIKKSNISSLFDENQIITSNSGSGNK